MLPQLSVTKLLARYVSDTHYDDLSPEVIWKAKQRTADLLAIGLSGYTTRVGSNIQAFAKEASPTGAATLWGSGNAVTAELAALANATTTFHLELDDCHRTSHAHPGVSVIPAALATCEERKLDAKSFLTAVVVGYDVITRAGMAVSPSIFVDRVFLAPGMLAPLGAVAAVGKLFGLGEDEMAQALGTAAFLSPLALFEAFAKGAPIKDTAMGWGNLVGIWAVKLCSYGFVGPITAIEGDFGYAKAASDFCNLDKIAAPVNINRGILNTGIKPYACCRQHHSAVDAILEIREKYNLNPRDVVRIVDRTFAVASRGSHRHPDTIASATYSAPFILASALATGLCWREQFKMDKIKDPYLLELADKVEVVKDDELDALYDEKWPAIVEVWTKDGNVLSARRDIPKGEPEAPLSDEELKAKFISLATDAVSISHAEKLWRAVFAMEELGSIAELTALLRVGK